MDDSLTDARAVICTRARSGQPRNPYSRLTERKCASVETLGASDRSALRLETEGQCRLSHSTRVKEHIMRNHLKLSLAVAALALSAAAFAQEDPMAKGQGQQQKQESMSQPATPAPSTGSDTQSAAQAKFDALDANHDGYIDKQEAAVSKPLANEFAKLDTNKDSKLSLMEFQSVKDLASIKTSKDGYQ
jgi:hypothetical protein